jgi:hypothetical protein
MGERATSGAKVGRWKIEAVLAIVFAVATVVTAIVPQWIEALGLEPDGGDGSAEWGIVVVLGVLALVATFASRWHYVRRNVSSTAADGGLG